MFGSSSLLPLFSCPSLVRLQHEGQAHILLIRSNPERQRWPAWDLNLIRKWTPRGHVNKGRRLELPNKPTSANASHCYFYIRSVYRLFSGQQHPGHQCCWIRQDTTQQTQSGKPSIYSPSGKFSEWAKFGKNYFRFKTLT